MSGYEQEGAGAPERGAAELNAGELSLGLRLRQRREAMGLDVAELAARLKLRTQIVEAIETDRLESLGAGVFTRGYLSAYAKAVGMPLVVLDSEPAARTTAPNLVSHVKPRYGTLLGRYTSRLGHVFLTAAIVVPFIWMATSNQLPSQRATLTSLDVPDASAGQSVGAPGAVTETPRELQVMASLAPMFPPRPSAPELDAAILPPSVSADVAPVPSNVDVDANAAVEGDAEVQLGGQGLSLSLSSDSWVEVATADGRVLEAALLRAGVTRSFPVDSGLRVSLGNAGGVELLLNGEAIDVSPYQRANVARFRLDADGSLAPVSPAG